MPLYTYRCSCGRTWERRKPIVDRQETCTCGRRATIIPQGKPLYHPTRSG